MEQITQLNSDKEETPKERNWIGDKGVDQRGRTLEIRSESAKSFQQGGETNHEEDEDDNIKADREEDNTRKMKTLEEWEDGMKASGSLSKMSWADEAEGKPEEVKKTSVWDNFDIAKIATAGFKLDYVSPDIHGETPICEIEHDDINTELMYWKNAIVCYVLGACPFFSMPNGHI
ncbi:hypothetical protein RND71_016506 [Anisodus tanguticus]|uniref:Uncharacterized protein n=1 Tax=Anisodus tanguticus TaxID=243964 RepID=A0AAE1S9E2_9SOLA|nr:hypothetical protein RND71_016506 [Anisodus tanguticus]